MDRIKTLINFLDTFFLSIWGLTIIDLLPLAQIQIFKTFDDSIKVLMAFSGLVYFIVTIPHKLKMQNLERKIKKEQYKKLALENGSAIDDGKNGNT